MDQLHAVVGKKLRIDVKTPVNGGTIHTEAETKGVIDTVVIEEGDAGGEESVVIFRPEGFLPQNPFPVI